MKTSFLALLGLVLSLVQGGENDSNAVAALKNAPGNPTPVVDAPADGAFEEVHAIQPSQVASYIDSYIASRDRIKLTVESTDYTLTFVDELDGTDIVARFAEGIVVIGIGSDGRATGTLEIAYGDTTEPFALLDNADRRYLASGLPVTEQGDTSTVSGNLRDDASDAMVSVSLSFNEALVLAGSSQISIEGSVATVTGTLGNEFYVQLRELGEGGSGVTTLKLQNIGGSINDDINVHSGRLLRQAGFNTLVPSDGQIYSGGVDIFAAGAARLHEDGGIVGVHSWCCDTQGRPADALSRDDPGHGVQLTYSREMLGAELGEAFYFFTINAAPFEGMYNMTKAELRQYLLTE